MDGCLHSATISGLQGLSWVWCIQKSRPTALTANGVNRITTPSQVDPREVDDEGKDFTGTKPLGRISPLLFRLTFC